MGRKWTRPAAFRQPEAETSSGHAEAADDIGGRRGSPVGSRLAREPRAAHDAEIANPGGTVELDLGLSADARRPKFDSPPGQLRREARGL